MSSEKSKIIKKALIDAGLTQVQIAIELKLTPETINKVIQGRGVSARVTSYLNKRLGINTEVSI